MTTKVFLGTQEIVSYVLKNKPLGIERLVSENTISAGGKSVICLDGITALGSGVLCSAYYNNLNITEIPNFSNIETVEKYSLYNCFNGCTNLTGSLNFSSLTSINGNDSFYNAFNNCSNITGHLDLSNCEMIKGDRVCYNAFINCTGITSVDLHNLRQIDSYYSCNNMFANCTGITGHLDLSSLVSITNCAYGCMYMFGNCTGITSVDLHNLVTIQSNQNACSYMFYSCTGLVSVDLRNLMNVSSYYSCTGMFSGCTSLQTIKFESVEYINNNGTLVLLYIFVHQQFSELRGHEEGNDQLKDHFRISYQYMTADCLIFLLVPECEARCYCPFCSHYGCYPSFLVIQHHTVCSNQIVMETTSNDHSFCIWPWIDSFLVR